MFSEEVRPHIFFVAEHLVNRFRTPLRFMCSGKNPVLFESFADLYQARSFKLLPENPFDHGRLFRHDDRLPVLAPCVSEELSEVHLHLTLLEAVLDAEPDIL